MEVTANKTMMEAAYETIKKAILTGYFSPSSQLVENDLIQMMNISRTPLREALRRLEKEGLVVFKPYKGVFVNFLTKRDAEKLYQVQSVLEGLAARLAAHSHTEEVIRKLQDTIEKGSLAVKQNNVDEIVQQSQRFHYLLWECGGSPILNNMLNILRDQISLLRNQTLVDMDRMHENFLEHKEIFKTIKDSNGEGAERLMREHIDHAARVAMKIITDSGEGRKKG